MLANLEKSQKYQLLGIMMGLMRQSHPILTETDILCLAAFYTHILQEKEYFPQLVKEKPLSLAKEILEQYDELNYFCQALTVLPFINAEVDYQRIHSLLELAQQSLIKEAYIEQLQLIANNQLQDALEHMTVKNYESIYGQTVSYEEALAVFKPYENGKADAQLAQKYKDLEQYAQETLGYQFWQLYTRNGYQFPGEEGAYAESFAARHDATHLLAGYNTTAQGEILVSTFTARMHDKYPISGHIIPVIFSWHLKIDPLGGMNRANYGKLDINKFWLAWHRGEEMKIDFFSKDWDFWAHVGEDLNELKKRYNLL